VAEQELHEHEPNALVLVSQVRLSLVGFTKILREDCHFAKIGKRGVFPTFNDWTRRIHLAVTFEKEMQQGPFVICYSRLMLYRIIKNQDPEFDRDVWILMRL
jgi:hypothetical protein